MKTTTCRRVTGVLLYKFTNARADNYTLSGMGLQKISLLTDSIIMVVFNIAISHGGSN